MQLTKEKLAVLKESFDLFDSDQDGLITKEEFASIYNSLGETEDNLSDSLSYLIYTSWKEELFNIDQFLFLFKNPWCSPFQSLSLNV